MLSLIKKYFILKIVLVIIAVVFLVSISATVFFYFRDKNRLNSNLNNEIQNTKRLIEEGYSVPLWSYDPNTIKTLNNAILSGTPYQSISIFDIEPDGSYSVKISSAKTIYDDTIDFKHIYESCLHSDTSEKTSGYIYYDNEIIGKYELSFTRQHINKQLIENLYNLIIVFMIISVAIIFALILFLNNLIIRKLFLIIDFAKSVALEKKYDKRIDFKSDDETGLLANSINEMLFEIEQKDFQKDEISRNLMESKQYLQSVFNACPDAIFVHDAETGIIIDINESTCQMFLCEREHLVGNDVGVVSVDELPYDTDHALKWLDKARNEGSQIFEWRSKRLDNSVFWSEVNINFAIIGQKERFIVLVRDITDRKKSAEELIKTKSYLSNIIESMSSMLITIDENGKVTQWNQVAVNYTGIPATEAYGKLLWDIVPDFKKYKEFYSEVIKTRKKREFLREIFKTKNTIYRDVALLPLIANGANGMILKLEDVTETEKRDNELRQMQKMETVGTLAAGLAHDFNNVLGGIVGAVSIIKFKFDQKKQISDNELFSHIKAIDISAKRAGEMVNQLLTLSRKQDLCLVPVELNTSVRHILGLCRSSFDKSIEIVFKNPDFSAMVNADPTQIEQVLLNIAVNASHAMTIMRNENEQKGGILTISIDKFVSDIEYCKIHVEAQPFMTYIRLTMQDTGVGIDKKIIAKIFDPFFTTKEKGKGTGLGLAMVYSIIKQHNGFLDVYSEHGIGSTFVIYLPLLIENTVNVTDKIVDFEILKGKGCILVVDDEEMIRQMAQTILNECGYEVVLATDGLDGIEKLKYFGDKIDLVILDMVMPKISGKEAFFEMKKIREDLKVLLTSGFKQDERVQSLLDSGVSGFVNKPYTLMSLAEAVKNVLLL